MQSQKRTLFLLGAILLFHTILFFVFQHLDRSYQTWDSAGHASTSFLMADGIKAFLTGDQTLVGLLKTSNYYPPLVLFVGSLVSLAFGYNADLLVYITLLAFLITIILVYKIVELVFADSKKALLTAFVFSIFPEIVEQSHVFHLDIPLTLFLLSALYFLLKSENFGKFWPSLWFFVMLSFAQLTKWYGFLFLLAPVAWSFYSGFTRGDGSNSKRTVNILSGTVLALAVTLPWYLVNLKDFLALAKVFSRGEADDPTKILSLSNLFYYPKNILTFQTLFLPFIVVLLGIGHQFVKNKKTAIYITTVLLVPLLAFMLISNKNLRYIIPLAPLLAYLIVDFCMYLDGRLKIVTAAIILYLLAGMSFLTFNQMKAEAKGLLPISMLFAGPNYKAWYEIEPTFYSYEPDYYPIEEMLLFIVNDARRSGNVSLGIANLSDSENFSAATFEMLRLENGLRNIYLPVPYFQFEPFKSDFEIVSYLTEVGAEYVVAPQFPGPEGLRNYTALKQVVDFLASPRNDAYEAIKTYNFPDGNVVTVYKRIGSEQVFVKSGECTDKAGFLDGVESIKLEPEHTYILFTGYFAIQEKIKMEFDPYTLYILQIENTTHETVLDVHNLPKTGSSMCSRSGLELDLTSEIKVPLEQPGKCAFGNDCRKVVLVKWSVGDAMPVVQEYTRADFMNF